MRQQTLETVQHAAAGKAAFVAGPAIATAPSWIDFVQGPTFQALAIILGVLVSITVILVNIQSLRQKSQVNQERRRQERIRTALLEEQAKDRGISVD